MSKAQNILTTLLAMAIFAFVSCNNPMDRTYSPQTYEEDMQEIQKSKKVSEVDLQLMAKYILVVKLSGNNISGKTYDDILNKIKSLQQQNDNASNMQAVETDGRRKRLSSFLEVNLQNKVFTKVQNKDAIIYTVKLKNISSQKIKTVSGNIVINDLLEQPVKSLNIFVDEDILPGRTLTKTYTPLYNNADENDLRMRSKDLLEMRMVWNPQKIIFENGSLAE